MSKTELLSKSGEAAQLAFQWMLDSGIQDQSDQVDYRGGVNAWFDLQDETYPFIYSEITGYAVNAYLFIHTNTGNEACLTRAKQAADWLLAHRDTKTGFVQTRLKHKNFGENYFESWIFTFDQWIIVYGLAELARVSGEERYKQECLAIADSLITRTVKDNGSFYPVYNLESGQGEETLDKWSRQPGGFHAKALMALEAIYQLTNKKRYRETAEALAAFTLSIQTTDGRFPTLDQDDSSHLHPFLYTLEGLLSYGISTKSERCIESVKAAFKWIMQHQNEDGSLFAYYVKNQFLPHVRVDILAQALRVGTVLQKLHPEEPREAFLNKLDSKLLSYQIISGHQAGGFLYGQEENGKVHYHVNAWVTMFAAQALWMSSAKSGDMSFFI